MQTENRPISTRYQAERPCFLQPAEAGFVCVDAVSTARSDYSLQPAEAGFVCVDAVSTARSDYSLQPAEAGFVCVDAVSTARSYEGFPTPR